MKKFGKIVAVMMTAAMLLAGCGGTGDSTTAVGGTEGTTAATGSGLPSKVVVGTNPEFPPFEYINDNGEPDGFDIALMKEIGKRAGFEVEIKSMEFDGLMGAMETKGIDMAIAGMTVREDREKSVDFSDSYYHAKQVMIVKKDNTDINAFADLEGKKIGVQNGTTGDLLVTPEEEGAVVKKADIKRMNKGAEAVMDLKNGGVDVVVIDALPAEEFVANNDDLKIIKDDSVDPEDYAIAVQKGDTTMLEAVNTALKAIQDDGTFDKLVSEYMGGSAE